MANRFDELIKSKNIYLLAFIFFAFKFLLSHFIPLIGDEAYYWVWSQHLQLSYFDHPPFVAWLFKISSYGANVLGPRWASILLSSGTIFLWIQISDPEFKSKLHLKYWILILMLSPMIGFGSLIVTPDVPLMFFWSLSTWLALRIIQSPKKLDYIFLGISLGLGFCSKYHIVLWVFAFLVYFWREKKWHLVQAQGLFLTFIFGLIFSSPVIIWNIQNNFSSFRFQFNHGLNQGPWDWRWLVEYILGQVLVLLPLVFSKRFFKCPQDSSQKIHFYLGWTPLVFFLFSSLKGSVEINWPLMAFAHLGFLFTLQISNLRWPKIYLGFWGLITPIVVICAIWPQYNFIHDKLNEPKKYSDAALAVTQFRPLFTSNYQMAASIWYFSQKPTFKLYGQSRYDFFDELPESKPTTNEFFYLKEDYQDMPVDFSNDSFEFKEFSKPFAGHTLFKATKR